MAGARPNDHWNLGDPYEFYVGRWSRRVAPAFLAWLALPPGLDWLDVGCGTGALTASIVERGQPARVFAVEPSEGFLAKARERVQGKAVLQQAGAARLPFDDRALDVVVSGLVLNFIPELDPALAEMRRTVKAGGTLAAYVWDYAQGMALMRHFWDAAVSLHPEASALDEGVRFPLCRPTALTAAFERAALADIAVEAIDVATRFRDFDDYWTPFLGGQGPAPSFVSALNESDRDALRERLRRTLPTGPDGAIDLLARAWAVRGRVSG
jgi:SAM-dependent methyltransferase